MDVSSYMQKGGENYMQLYIDFEFNGHKASDFQLLLCSFDNEDVSSEQDTGYALNLSSSRIPASNSWLLKGANYENPYVFNLTMIINNNCGQTDKIYFTYEEVREIENWLSVSTYTNLILDDEEYKDLIFRVIPSTIQRHKQDGNVIGFSVEVTCDAPFAWKKEVKELTLNGEQTVEINNISDDNLSKYIFPMVEFTPASDGGFSIKNETDNSEMKFEKLLTNDKLTIDSKGIITTDSALDVYTTFNKHFLRLLHGTNSLSIKGNGTLKLTMIYPRKVGM